MKPVVGLMKRKVSNLLGRPNCSTINALLKSRLRLRYGLASLQTAGLTPQNLFHTFRKAISEAMTFKRDNLVYLA